MDLTNQILEHQNDPHKLERLFRNNPDEFGKRIKILHEKEPQNLIFQIWNERLFFKEHKVLHGKKLWLSDSQILFILIVFAGSFLKFPLQLLNTEQMAQFFIKDAVFAIPIPLAALFIIKKRPKNWIIGLSAILFALSFLYINVSPFSFSQYDTFILSLLHLPFFLWSIVGLAYVGDEIMVAAKRFEFIKWNGEASIYIILFYIATTILFGLTIMLGIIIGDNPISEMLFTWFMQNLWIYLMVGVVMVAFYYAQIRLDEKQRIFPIVAKLFCPLFSIVLFIFLVLMLAQGKDPYNDREFLLLVNIILLTVLTTTIFSISGRKEIESISLVDYFSIILIITTLVIDLIALSGIVFRLSSYGLTPNRIAVLGVNLLILGNLVGMLRKYHQVLSKKESVYQIEVWIGNYLPVYTVWSFFMTFIFPLIYRS